MTVTQDATSLKYIPQSAAEWTTLLSGSGISNPDVLLLCQEASGSLADSIGAFGAWPVTGGAPAYAQPVSGWAKKGIKFADGGVDCISKAGFANVTASSQMCFAWVQQGKATSSWDITNIIGFGQERGQNGVALTADANNTGILRNYSGVNEVDSGPNNGFCDGAVHPLIVQINRTAGTTRIQTDIDTFSPVIGTFTGSQTRVYLGGQDDFATYKSAGTVLVYFALWSTSAHAELDAAHRATLISRMTSGPAAAGSGRLTGSSLVKSGLVNSPLINCSASLSKRRGRYVQLSTNWTVQ